jgi:hypothetical protein
MATHEYIKNEATAPAASWSGIQVARFHCYNKNGLFQKIMDNVNVVRVLVEQDQVDYGWHYSSGIKAASWHLDDLLQIARAGRVNRFRLEASIQMAMKFYRKQAEELASIGITNSREWLKSMEKAA